MPVVAGPFSLGNSITRATINVDPKTGRVIVGSNLPTIVKGGIPVRLRSVTVEINRPNFLTNPTNCGVLATESTVTGLGNPGTSVSLSSPFQVSNCSALAFKPSFKASTSGTPTKAGGASLETTISQAAGQANIKSVSVQLPKQLPSRLTTLQKACAAATFEANPAACPAESVVGGARAKTPVLSGKLTGPAILVSHAGAAFPDLDLVLDANGVRVILVGNTDIKNGITTTTFASTPDVPVTSITLNLPMGPHSALAAFGNLCAKPLVMPTTIVGQNGVMFKQNTIVKAAGCGVRIVGHKVIGNTAYITVQDPRCRPCQRQREERGEGLPPPEPLLQSGDVEGGADEARAGSPPSVQSAPARGLPAQEPHPGALHGVRDRDVPLGRSRKSIGDLLGGGLGRPQTDPFTPIGAYAAALARQPPPDALD